MTLTKRDLCKDAALCRQAKDIYLEAFPAEERLPWWILKLNSRREGVDLTAWMEGDTLCAMTASVTVEDTCFLLFFAVRQDLRGKGYGSRVLTQLQENYAMVYLNIECITEDAPNLPERKKRLAFYQKNGFHDTGWHVWEVGGIFRVLSTCESIHVPSYKKIFRKLSLGFWDVRLEEAQ